MQKTWVVWLGAMICCALWGSAFPCIKLGYEWMRISAEDTAAQILYAGCRFTLAGILTIFVGSLFRRRLLCPSRKAVPKVVSLALLQTVIQYLFFYIGLAHTTGVKASIIEGVNVFVAILVAGGLFRQEKITAGKLIGCAVGFAGVVLVNLSGGSIEGGFTLLGEGFIFLSTVSYAFSSVLIKRYGRTEDTVMLSGWQFLLGGLIMTACGLLFGGRLQSLSGKALLMLVWLAVVSAAAYSLWGILLKYHPVSMVAVFGFMNPVFGVLLSALLLKETDALGIAAVAALLLVCAGIYIVNGPCGKEKEQEKKNYG